MSLSWASRMAAASAGSPDARPSLARSIAGSDAIARAGRHVEREGNRLSLRPRVDGVESARLGDRPAVDRGRDRGVIVAARAQSGIDLGQRRLGALQQAEAVAAQRLLLLEALDELLEVGLHLLVS